MFGQFEHRCFMYFIFLFLLSLLLPGLSVCTNLYLHIVLVQNYITKTYLSVCTCVSSPVSGASHEVFIQRVPPLAPAGPVTHGSWEGELISPYIPATATHTHHTTPKGGIHFLPCIPVHCGGPYSPSGPGV